MKYLYALMLAVAVLAPCGALGAPWWATLALLIALPGWVLKRHP